MVFLPFSHVLLSIDLITQVKCARIIIMSLLAKDTTTLKKQKDAVQGAENANYSALAVLYCNS